MKKIQLPILTIITFISINLWADEATNYLDLADDFGANFSHAKLQVRILEYKKCQVDDEQTFQVYNNEGDSLVLMDSGNSKGNRVLLTSKGMYLLVKKASRPIRITPMQRLMGQSSYGDLANLTLSDDYESKLVSKTDELIELELNARSKKSTYRTMQIWLDAKDFRPIKSNVFLPSGKFFKNIVYTTENNKVNKITYLSEDSDDEDIFCNRTDMIFDSIEEQKISKRLFTNQGMKGLIK